MRVLTVVGILVIFSARSSAQNQRGIDSLQKVFAKINNDSLKMELLFTMSQYISDIDSHLHYLNRARLISENIKYSHGHDRARDSLVARLAKTSVDSDKVKLYYMIADYQTDTLLWKETMSKGVALAAQKHLFQLQAQGLNAMGKGLMGFGLTRYYSKSIILYDSALKMATRAGDKSDEAQSYHFLGEIYRVEGDYSRALDYYNKGNQVANEAHDSTQMMYNYHDLGWMRISMKDYPLALEYLSKGRMLAIATKDSFWIADITMHMGEAYWSAQNYDTAMDYSQQALYAFHALHDTLHISLALIQMGNILLSQKRFEEAGKNFLEAKKFEYASGGHVMSLLGY